MRCRPGVRHHAHQRLGPQLENMTRNIIIPCCKWLLKARKCSLDSESDADRKCGLYAESDADRGSLAMHTALNVHKI